MNKNNHIETFANHLGPKHKDGKGNLHFRARVIYKWTDKMQQDMGDINITQRDGSITSVTISNAPSLKEDKFVLSFSSQEQSFSQDEGGTMLFISGKDNRLHGSYTVEIIPEQ